MNTPDVIIKRAAREIAEGRHWRAKEILRGAIASAPVDPSILEAYGALLDSMGDRVEAGKYLFLSGVREPHYADAISLFLDRHGQGGVTSLVGLFPASVRRLPFEQLPPAVQADLRARGGSPDLFRGKNWSEPSRPRLRWLDNAAGFAAVLVFLFFIASLVIGVVTLSRWAFGLIFG